MWKWLCLMVVATPAFAGPKKNVDVSVTYRRTIEDASTTTDSTNSACVSTTKTANTLSEQTQIAVGKLPLSGKSFTLPDTHEASLAGQAHYDFKTESHSSSCNDKTDLVATANADADAKQIEVIVDGTSVRVASKFGEAKGQGTMIDTPKTGAANKQDAAKLVASQAAVFEGAWGPATLWTATQIDMMTKAAPHWLDMQMVAGQDKPVVVQTSGDNIDITYTNTQTVDMAKLDPSTDKNVKKSASRKITTELSIHVTPSK